MAVRKFRADCFEGFPGRFGGAESQQRRRVELQRGGIAFEDVTAPPQYAPGVSLGHAVDEIRKAMLAQVTGSVRWTDNVAWMSGHGATTFVEFGPGKVLTGLVKRTLPGAVALSCETPADLQAVLEALGIAPADDLR